MDKKELNLNEAKQAAGGFGTGAATIVQANCEQCNSRTRHRVEMFDDGNAKFVCTVCQKTTTRPSPF